ncbi:hypothetical protein NM688_g794 [Phlebia brevispora]|uniref:Uncharacterized protein n=1 Tax=Phlebia brevispora TaxID=194682 RepID=A0ACC1TDM4_9APHY|nr:hypothetical protein NM688_g794 [Phlebia brevispora]
MVEFDLTVFRREPTPQEVDAAQKEIDRQEMAISTIEHRVQRLLSDIQELRKAQVDHAQAVRRCKGVITLARRIPEELLARIFEQCVADGWSRAPVIVSHVCSAWRKAALSPRVWSYVYVNSESPDMLGRTRFWLSMARFSPLHISLISTWRTDHSQLSDAVSLLGRHAQQWTTLSVESDMLRHTDLILSRCPPSMPNLREISVLTELHFDHSLDGEEETLHLGDTFSVDRSPAVRELRLICNAIPNDLTLPAHISNLHLSLKESPTARPLSALVILNLLDTLPALESLTLTMPLYYEHPYVEEENLEHVVTFPYLTSLTMYGPPDMNGLLVHLRAPALRRLQLRSLEDTGYRQESIGPTLLTFISGSSPPLELLELHDIDLTPHFFAACFSAMPQLRTLHLHESSISDPTLRLLEPSPGGEGLCPRLTHLDLRWCGQLTGRALVNLVSSRLHGNIPGAFPGVGDLAVPITEIAVLNCCYVQERDVVSLAQMTVCRVCLRDDDYCRACKCCDNGRYRQRLKMRYLAGLSKEEKRYVHRMRILGSGIKLTIADNVVVHYRISSSCHDDTKNITIRINSSLYSW